MTWPTPQDYNEAIQSPRLCFDDPELKEGEPECNAFGLPRPICGSFANVYRMKCAHKDWAVRCFVREFSDQQKRYSAISQHLSKIKLRYTVGFEFLSKGIRVGQQWYPILKMEWIQGELLHDYIERHLDVPAMLFALSNRWFAMIKALEQANIGHGDLQHGNVLVANNDFRLIDYDGMYVPALTGQSSHEKGHRNYQHPLRTELHFAPYLDNFSAWVIYLSLVALSIDRTLWDRVGAGDESILFREKDFDDPGSSSTLALLSNHVDTRLQTLADFFQSLLYLSPEQIPPLSDNLASSATTVSRILPPGIEWVADHVKAAGTQRTNISNAISPNSDITSNVALPSENSTWVLDFISPPATNDPITFSSSVAVPRIIALASFTVLLALFAVLFFTTAFYVVSVSFLIVAVLLISRSVFMNFYRQDSVVSEMNKILIRERRESRSVNFLERTFKTWQAKKEKVLAEQAEKRNDLTKQMSDLQNKERNEKGRVDMQLKQSINSISGRRLASSRKEAEDLRNARETVNSEISKLNNQIVLLVQAEADEMSRTLQTIQDNFVKDYLSRCRIIDAFIYGIGDTLKGRLRASGIYTAAEVEYGRVTSVDGIGSQKGSALTFWRSSMLTQAKAKMPTSLSPSEVNAIRQNYGSQKRQLWNQRDDAPRRLAAQETLIRDQYAERKKQLDKEESDAQSKASQELQAITNRYAQPYSSISQRLVQLNEEVQVECQKIEDEISKLRKRISDSRWQLTKTRRELKPFESISFRNYIRFIFLGRYAGSAKNKN